MQAFLPSEGDIPVNGSTWAYAAGSVFLEIPDLIVECSCTDMPTEFPSASPTKTPSLEPSETPSVVPSPSPSNDCPCFIVGDVCVTTTAMDVLFLVDASTSIADFNLMMSMLTDAVETLPSDVRIAVVTFGTVATSYITFDDQTDLAAQIAAIPYIGGGTWTASALTNAYHSIFFAK